MGDAPTQFPSRFVPMGMWVYLTACTHPHEISQMAGADYAMIGFTKVSGRRMDEGKLEPEQ